MIPLILQHTVLIDIGTELPYPYHRCYFATKLLFFGPLGKFANGQNNASFHRASKNLSSSWYTNHWVLEKRPTEWSSLRQGKNHSPAIAAAFESRSREKRNHLLFCCCDIRLFWEWIEKQNSPAGKEPFFSTIFNF